jgi:hypothetical protein
VGLSYVSGGGYALLMEKLTHRDVLAMMHRVGEITLTTEASLINNDNPGLVLNWLHANVKLENDGPCVYAWAEEEPNGSLTVLYIGKVGTTLKQRCREHEGGFTGKGKGSAHAKALWPKLRSGSRVHIYALKPPPVPFMGHMIPSHSSVEDWLLTVVNPRPAQNHQPKGKKAATV